MNTSILVQLGNGENFIFDIGEGSVANYVGGGFALNEFDKVFITHLHVDAFDVFPIGKGWDLDVHEFDFRDNGGVIYDKDGASGYRLDWNDLCFVWTGDGRPSKLEEKYAKGCDVYVTEMQPELVEISSGVQGVPPFLGRYTIDTHHTPGYAAGYLANKVQPRLFMTTHMPFDPYLNEEAVAEVREHWSGPFHFGAPDGIVVNVTKESLWVREGIIPDFPNSRAPQQDFSNGQLIVPLPRHSRDDIQEPFVREMQIDPSEYYPEGYMPELLEEWPVDSDLVVPIDKLPASLEQSMGAEWRLREKNRKILEEKGEK